MKKKDKEKEPFDPDIHGGGVDLLFPHHENEIAQSLTDKYGKGSLDISTGEFTPSAEIPSETPENTSQE